MKYANILNETWEYLENNYKASEISIKTWCDLVERKCDNDYCLKQCIKMLWEQWEWYDLEEREYYKNYIKDNYGVKVV